LAGGGALATTALAACGLPGGVGPGSPSARKATGKVEFWTDATVPYRDRIGSKLVTEFEQLNPGVKINWTDTPYADLLGKLVPAVVAGNPPDLTYADRYVTKSFACKGAARDLDGYIKQSRSFKSDNLWPQLHRDVTFKGKVYGMPPQGNAGQLWINKNHFREVGLDPEKPPTTWDQAIQTIQRLTRRSGAELERAGWVPARGWGVPWMVMYFQLGGDLTDADDRKATFNNERAAQVFEWQLRVNEMQGGEAAIDALYAGANIWDAFAQGKVSMLWGNNSARKARWANVPGLEVGNSYWPTPPGGQRSNYFAGATLILPKGSQNPDAAFAYVEYMFLDDAQVRWALDFDMIPATKSASNSERYVNTGPEQKTVVGDLQAAKWVISAPGGDQALKFQTGVANNIMQRKMTVREALDDAVRSAQLELDEAARTCVA
jgi:multiple sugar transport system substrate-binding protein